MAKQTFTTGQVLTAAQMTSLQQTAMLGGEASAKTASYTLVAADAGTAISMSNASATTITVNTALFAAGDTVQITNLGVGICTITAGTATVNTSASLALAQYESGTLDFTSTSAAIFIKGAGAAAASGGMTLLSTTTLTGASTTISGISGSHKNLLAIISGVTNASSDDTLVCKPNNANTSSVIAGDSSAFRTSNTTIILSGKSVHPSRTDANNTYALQFFDYASTSSFKSILWSGFFVTATPTNVAIWGGGAFRSNTAITSLVFLSEGGNLSTGTVLLYGVS